MKNLILFKNGTLIINEGLEIINSEILKELSKKDIKNIILPKSVKEINQNTFNLLLNLENVDLSNCINLKHLGDFSFMGCLSLKNISLPNNLESIGSHCFEGTSISTITIPNSVTEIEENAFSYCHNLKKIILPKYLKILKSSTFSNCENLKEVILNDNLKTIGNLCFMNCTSLENLIIPNSVSKIEGKLETIISKCISLKYVSFPLTCYMNNETYSKLINVQNVEIKYNNKVIPFNKIKEVDSKNGKNRTYLLNYGEVVNINSNGESTIIKQEEYLSKTTKWNKIDKLQLTEIYKLQDWLKYDILPNKIVIKNMPKKDINLFYLNNNAKNWFTLIKNSKMKEDKDKEALFLIAYTLGVFSKSGKESKIATDYINNYILNKYNTEQIFNMFSKLNTYDTPYNKNFAKFFMMYFKDNPKFLHIEIESGDKLDLLEQCHNNFENILEKYSTKKITTRFNNERLTPELVMIGVRNKNYNPSNSNSNKIIETIAPFGYSQDMFNEVEKWFQQGINIPKKDIILKIKKDILAVENSENLTKPINKNCLVTYELLEKENPLSIVLGDITNCCQKIGCMGQECLKYGLTKPNSSFIIFKHNNKIIGQSWVWYDKESKTICLDNIEVPNISVGKIIINKELQEEFFNCLLRLKKSFIETMGKDKVQKVTIGVCYNEISKLLQSKFNIDQDLHLLNNYSGYTDAGKQIVIEDYNIKNNINIEVQK